MWLILWPRCVPSGASLDSLWPWGAAAGVEALAKGTHRQNQPHRRLAAEFAKKEQVDTIGFLFPLTVITAFERLRRRESSYSHRRYGAAQKRKKRHWTHRNRECGAGLQRCQHLSLVGLGGGRTAVASQQKASRTGESVVAVCLGLTGAFPLPCLFTHTFSLATDRGDYCM